MVEVMLEIRVSQSASACQCSSRSSWEQSTDLSGIQDELTGLQASVSLPRFPSSALAKGNSL